MRIVVDIAESLVQNWGAIILNCEPQINPDGKTAEVKVDLGVAGFRYSMPESRSQVTFRAEVIEPAILEVKSVEEQAQAVLEAAKKQKEEKPKLEVNDGGKVTKDKKKEK